MAKFSVSDTVVYGTSGVCAISEIKEIPFHGRPTEYYVLRPLNSAESTVFVPVENEALTSKMKRVMSRSEIDSLLRDKTEYVPWIEDRRERAEKYSAVISGGSKREILCVLRQLYKAKEDAEARGKKQYVSDRRMMTLAEKLVSDEFSYVMELPKVNVAQYIFRRAE